MTDEQFDSFVSRLEAEYQGRHPALVRRSAALAILGYVGLGFFLAAGAVVTAGAAAFVIYAPSFVSIKLGLLFGLPALIVTWAILRGLWVRLEAPTGVPVTRKDSPALFGLIRHDVL